MMEKEKQFITMYMAKPIWDGTKWSTWLSQDNFNVSMKYRVEIPVPPELLLDIITDVEVTPME